MFNRDKKEQQQLDMLGTNSKSSVCLECLRSVARNDSGEEGRRFSVYSNLCYRPGLYPKCNQDRESYLKVLSRCSCLKGHPERVTKPQVERPQVMNLWQMRHNASLTKVQQRVGGKSVWTEEALKQLNQENLMIGQEVKRDEESRKIARFLTGATG